MLIRKILKIGQIIGLLSFSLGVLAQGGNSPYSVIGIGDLNSRGNIINHGMGGAGLALNTPAYGNILNPAALTNNRITFFDVGVFAQMKRISSGEQIQEDMGGNISHAALGFPVARNWTMGVGIRPFSSVNYDLSFAEPIDGTQEFVEYNYLGEGGINQVYWSHGVRLFTGFSIGLEIGYNFGSITKQARSELQDATNDVVATNFDRLTISEFSFMPAVHYTYNLTETHYLGLAATLMPATEYSAKTFRALQRRTNTGQPIFRDTLINNEDGTIAMPQIINTGFVFGKQFNYTVAVDLSWEAWSDFQDFDGDQPLQDAFATNVGVEWIPDITSVSSYLKRVSYRAGAYFERLPYTLEGSQVEEMGVSVGLSLPVARGLSSINIAASYGRRGYNLEGLVSEEFLNIYLGLTINDRRWFIRRKIN